jgi:hypothetical protein
MADYCTTADVVRELPNIKIDASTKPSTTEVEQFCSDITAEMDARMRAVGITIPVTDSDLLQVLKPIAVNGVKAKILRSKQLEEGDEERAATFEELYQGALERIERRPSILREEDEPGQPQGTEREDTDIRFTRTGEEW